MSTKILIGFDSSEESYRAFDFALNMAASLPAPPEITVLSVVQHPGRLAGVDVSGLIDEATAEFKVYFKTLEEKAKAANLRISAEVAVGHPAEMIVRAAKEKGCQFVMLGSKRRSKIGRLILGSVSRHVASRAHCNVILVKKGLEPAPELWYPNGAIVSPAAL